jgi:DNA polymerase III epsilon subunit family exonuclease
MEAQTFSGERMLSRFVAIDLETTGLDPASRRIIEFGAVRVEDGKVAARFGKLCNPGEEIPPEVERLTGISNADLARSEPVEQVAGEFLAFLDGLPVVAHNASFDEAFLSAETGGRFSNDVYDTLELARVLLPTLPRHDLTTLVKYLELPQLTSHRAADDAEMTAGAFLALQKMLDALPLAVLREINWLLGGDKSTLARLFADAGRQRLVQGFSGGGEGEPIAEVFKDFSKLHVKRASKQEELSERKPLDSAEIERMFDESGLFGKSMPGYERRAEQIEMVRRVCAAFNDSKHLMIEAGTGTGKSMAYLVPAVAWAALNKRKVVISTNTKNLQEQLFHKDLPFLESVLPVRFKRAILKGRAN